MFPSRRPSKLTGVGHRDVIHLIRVQPDLPEAAVQDRGCEPLLQLESDLQGGAGQQLSGSRRLPAMAAPGGSLAAILTMVLPACRSKEAEAGRTQRREAPAQASGV